jgi:hypothetical protein
LFRQTGATIESVRIHHALYRNLEYLPAWWLAWLSPGWGSLLDTEANILTRSPSPIRTDTGRFLRPLPLPLGYGTNTPNHVYHTLSGLTAALGAATWPSLFTRWEGLCAHLVGRRAHFKFKDPRLETSIVNGVVALACEGKRNTQDLVVQVRFELTSSTIKSRLHNQTVRLDHISVLL